MLGPIMEARRHQSYQETEASNRNFSRLARRRQSKIDVEVERTLAELPDLLASLESFREQ